ncbi:NAD-P-binding protein [Trametes coccinea BRFM310]|uniref:NAD-P-binding protein n=1 Tax=Trametes coccinea (strain BRFM310) TaxID=1353009 RepID=A0A1Y2I880_TRAC3|nr:NAD-P-binding protein [Trametes coccinea BRFM310]
MSVNTDQYTWLITGCSRGIGLGLTRKLLEDPANFIIATCRNPEKAVDLEALKDTAKGTLHILKLDVDDLDGIRNSVKEVSEILGDRGLDYLVNNAAVNQKIDTAFSMDVEGWGAVFKTNVVAPALLGQVYLPLIEKSNKKTIVNVSSSLGAFGYGYGELWASYAITKTGLNMLTYKQRAERPDLMVVCLCPGWVKTDLGTDDAPLDLEDSVSAVAKVLTSLKPEDNGRLVNYKHELVPW